MFNNNFYNAAASRLYYTCFYAVTALLIKYDIGAKKHSGVKQMFGLHFVSTGLISRETGKFYTEIFELRQDADYESYFDLEEHQTVVLFDPARKLIFEIERLLSK